MERVFRTLMEAVKVLIVELVTKKTGDFERLPVGR